MGQAKLLFQRYEKKYLLTDSQYEQVIKAFDGKMVADEYGSYSIKNIYMDTANYDLIRTSVDGAEYKEKMRLRAYGNWDRYKNDKVFLELKKKYDGIVYKRRVSMSFTDAMFYVFRRIYQNFCRCKNQFIKINKHSENLLPFSECFYLLVITRILQQLFRSLRFSLV